MANSFSTAKTVVHWHESWHGLGCSNTSTCLPSGDRISLCPPHLGQGYIQEIPLSETAHLCVLDYTLNRDVLIDAPGDRNLLEFEFELAGLDPGYSAIVPYFGLQRFGIKPARQRFFKVEVFLQNSAFRARFQEPIDRFPPHAQAVADRVLQSMTRWGDRRWSEFTADRLSQLTFEQCLPERLYREVIALNYITRAAITPAMQDLIEQILTCPYRGATRRQYLHRLAFQLVELRLAAIAQPSLAPDDLQCIHEAASLLRNQLSDPPSVEALARQVGTNRFKLNQGFHQTYGTTPFGYLRDCRLRQARWLLVTSELPIEGVAAAIGYTSRSRFATAFRKAFGVNPKLFQMQAWKCAS